jgi:hypothetical protein
MDSHGRCWEMQIERQKTFASVQLEPVSRAADASQRFGLVDLTSLTLLAGDRHCGRHGIGWKIAM